MIEAQFQTHFTKWKRYNKKENALYELKVSKTNSIPFSRLEEHQELYLSKAKHDQICFKIPDTDYINKRPADMFCIYKGGGYVVVMFYTVRGTKHFYIIDIDDWIKERESSDRKSLTEERAKEIGLIGVLGNIDYTTTA